MIIIKVHFGLSNDFQESILTQQDSVGYKLLSQFFSPSQRLTYVFQLLIRQFQLQYHFNLYSILHFISQSIFFMISCFSFCLILHQNLLLQLMSNIRGFNDYSNRSNRAQQIRRNSNNVSMMGITTEDLHLLGNQIVNNKIPFINIMSDDVQPIQQSIPYTLKLVWCPGFSIISFSTLLLLAVWIMYILSLTQGIDTLHYMVLAPTPQTLRQLGAFNYQLLKDGEVWRLITATFLHFDLLQITMTTISILFVVTQLQQCYNPIFISILMILSAITGNITVGVFGNIYDIHVGTGSMIYGVMGGFLAYLTINWSALSLIANQLGCLIGMLIFFGMMFSFSGYYGFSCFFGSILGGYLVGLAILPGIRKKSWIVIAVGVGGIIAYWLTMFLIFYLAL